MDIISSTRQLKHNQERCRSGQCRINRIELYPPAKINLSLVIFHRRPDQFHELHTVMGLIDLFDDMTIETGTSPGINLKCSGLPTPSGPENLVYQAAQRLASYCNIEPAIDITLHKRIPAGAGLGGASSDTAACLYGLNLLWQTGLSLQELSSLAAQLGSDIPFFFYGPFAQCTGRGEKILPLPCRCRIPLLLISPSIHIATPLVYRHYRYHQESSYEAICQVEYFLKRGDLEGLIRMGINNLTEVTMLLSEELRQLRDLLQDLKIGPVFMSGSGSSLFIPGESAEQLLHWQKIISDKDCAQARVVHFLDRSHLSLEVHHESFGSQNQARQ